MGLGVLAHLVAIADEVAERDVHQAGVQVDACPLQPARLTAPDARHGRKPHVQGKEVHRFHRLPVPDRAAGQRTGSRVNVDATGPAWQWLDVTGSSARHAVTAAQESRLARVGPLGVAAARMTLRPLAPDDPRQAGARAEPDDLRMAADEYSTVFNRTESAVWSTF
jgi:hypothetical protein